MREILIWLLTDDDAVDSLIEASGLRVSIILLLAIVLIVVWRIKKIEFKD
ncbi:hypothetical protein R8510_04780 [Ralstonia chuxiongensis]|nr:hypothetical protein R8510_04780 [Ralstonia chuxiongensis]